jgi:hypothetical protein
MFACTVLLELLEGEDLGEHFFLDQIGEVLEKDRSGVPETGERVLGI